MCKQHRARAEEGGWGGKEGGAGREEGKCHDALDPHGHPETRSGDGEAERKGKGDGKPKLCL